MKHPKYIVGLMLVFSLSLTGVLVYAQEHEEEVHWGYEGEVGPENWGSLNEEWELCDTGLEQSPIDVVPEELGFEELPEITFDYQDVDLNVVNNGHTIQVIFPEGSAIEVNDTIYNLLQFHLHSPSEHTAVGQAYPLELHLVHSDEDGNLAVIGVLIEEGDENPAFADLWANLPAESGEPTMIEGVTLNADDLLPDDRGYGTYMGSLTTPPCTEGVTWLVLGATISLSAEQIEAFQAIYNGNARPTQPINDSQLVVDASFQEE